MPTDYTALSGKEIERLSVVINPGGWMVDFERPISTLLGSCVAVCLFDPKLKLGGMNHFLLPSRTGSRNEDTDVILAGDYSMEILLNAMLTRGAAKNRIVAKAFGGGAIVKQISMDIGGRNSRFARDWLAREGIPLTASDFGGPWSRKVITVPSTGDAFCRRMPISQPDAMSIVKAEQAYEQTLSKPVEKKIELF